MVDALFKKGSRLIPKNYWPLVLMLAKPFDFTLLDQFKKWFTQHARSKLGKAGDHDWLVATLYIEYLKLVVIEGAFCIQGSIGP